MNDMNRLLVFLMLCGLLFALYRYQDIIFGNFGNKEEKAIKYDTKQPEVKAIKEEGANKDNKLYKQDSILGSINTDIKSLFSNNSNGSEKSNNSNGSLFF